jgi:hypothetical protein
VIASQSNDLIKHKKYTMSEKDKRTENTKGKMEQHKKSTDTSRVKRKASRDPQKTVQKTGTKHDDWNDPTGNTHLSDKL